MSGFGVGSFLYIFGQGHAVIVGRVVILIFQHMAVLTVMYLGLEFESFWYRPTLI